MQQQEDNPIMAEVSIKPRLVQTSSVFRFGYYQKRLFVLLFLSAVPNPLSGLQFLATHYTPPYYCGDEATYLNVGLPNDTDVLVDNIIIYNGQNITSTRTQRKNNTCTTLSTESSTNITEKRCSNIIFDGVYKTAISEFEMVCDKAWLKPTMVMLYMVGKMSGIQIYGLLSDRFGRRIAFLAAAYWQSIASFLLSLSNSVTLYAVFVFLSGVGIVANYNAASLIGIETVEPEKRNTIYFALAIGYAFGYMILPAWALLFPDWRWFLRATSLVGLIYIPFYWLIDESPLWLLNNGTEKQARALFWKMAKTNGLDASEESNDLISKKKVVAKNNGKKMFKEIAKTCEAPILVWGVFVSIYSWVLVVMTWYVIALNNDNLSGNRFLNIFYAGVIELVSTFFFLFGSATFGGRNCYIFLSITIAFGLSITPLIALWSGTAVVVITMTNKLFVSISFNLVFVYTGQLFPTNTRQSTAGMINAVSRVGAIVAPFIIYAGESGSTFGPYLGMGVATFMSAMFYCFLPNTTKTALPNTIEEAKSLKYGWVSRFARLCKQ